LKQRHGLLYLIYVPSGVLFLAQLAFIKGVIGFAPSPIVLRDILNNLGDFHFGLYFVFSAIVLIQTYRTVRTPELRQQLKWVTRGSALAVIPYFLFQSFSRVSGLAPTSYIYFAFFPFSLF